MANIVVQRPHNMGKEAVREVTLKVAEQLRDSLRLDYRWEGDDLKFSGSGVTGAIRVWERGICVEIDLGWMLTPFRGRIEQQVNAYLDANLA